MFTLFLLNPQKFENLGLKIIFKLKKLLHKSVYIKIFLREFQNKIVLPCTHTLVPSGGSEPKFLNDTTLIIINLNAK